MKNSGDVARGVTAMAAVATLILNGNPAVFTGLDLFVWEKFRCWDRITDKLYETVTLIDWANPIQAKKCPAGFAHTGPCVIDGKCSHRGWCHICHVAHDK